MSDKDIVRVNQEYKEKALAQEWENIRDDKQAVIDRIKTMIVGTRKLADAEVFSLAVYAITNNLNPFAGECYFIDGIGVVPGVAGLRRKAREQLDREAKIAKMDGAQFAIEYSLATHEEAVFEDGDVAWKAVLTDTVSQSKWLGDLLSTTKLLQGLFPGVGFSELMAKAEEITGKKPTWWAVGVVSKDESFSKLEYENGKPTGSRKPEMWDRNERAKKRAAKNAIRQRFDIIIPDYLMNGASGGYDMDEPVISISIPEERPVVINEAQTLKDMGFPVDEQPEPQEQPEQKQATDSLRPYTPEQLKQNINFMRIKFEKENKVVNPQFRNMIAPNLEMCFIGQDKPDELRHTVLNYLVGKSSVKELTNPEVLAIRRWLDAKLINDEWLPSEMATKEAQAVITAALEEAGQQKLEL
jgi:hypothetical protein